MRGRLVWVEHYRGRGFWGLTVERLAGRLGSVLRRWDGSVDGGCGKLIVLVVELGFFSVLSLMVFVLGEWRVTLVDFMEVLMVVGLWWSGFGSGKKNGLTLVDFMEERWVLVLG
uniref:Transmembrane protein n=1 Tax=Populus alba TaxID=43335 RepID=A0A4U5Q1T6_POPAL|nr:hypothetical protein D5086_0000148820 [Populus alba]